VPVVFDGQPLQGKEVLVTCRKMRILLVVCGGVALAGWCSIVEAQGPSRLPSVLQIRAGDPVAAEVPAEPSLPASVNQASHLSQPEYAPALACFAGPVPVEVLVQYALANNPEIQAARYQAQALGARVPQAASLPDPQFAAIPFLEAIQTAAGPQEVALSLSQHLPLFGRLPWRSQVAYQDAMAAYARVMAVELGVVERVKRAYYDIYYLQRAIAVIRALEPRVKDVIAITETKVANGQVGLESLLQVQIELSALQTRLIQLQQAKTQAQARLAAILHLPPQTPIEAVAKFDRTRITHTARLLVELAEAYQPELDARRREIGRDRASVALARRQYWPDATVGLNWYSIGSAGLSPVATGEDAYSLSVGMNLPLYRKRLDAAVREAQYKTARSAREYAATLDQVRAEVQTLYAQFLEHHRVLEILGTEIVPNAEKTLTLSIEAYDVGKLGFQQMIDNYESLLNYEIDYYRREALREQAIASLERAVGCAVSAWPPGAADESEPPLAPLPPAAR
jgi:cobalt-zinc-cadmium efflux system outer membrane protein